MGRVTSKWLPLSKATSGESPDVVDEASGHEDSQESSWDFSQVARKSPWRVLRSNVTPTAVSLLLLGFVALQLASMWLEPTNSLEPLGIPSARHFFLREGSWKPQLWTPRKQEVFFDDLKECKGDAEKVLTEYFGDIVLIINNNYEKYAENSTNFWRAMYSNYFSAVVVISAYGIPELGIQAAWEIYPDAPDPWWGTWMFHFWALKRIMLEHPSAAGYLWTNDDVIINYWSLVGADKTQLWIPNSQGRYEYQSFDLDPTPEVANQTYGNWATRIQYRKQVKLALSLLDQKYVKQYERSMLPSVNVYHKRGCDLFYIPNRFAQAIVDDVLPALQGGHVVSELAIPLMFFVLDPPEKFSHVLDDMVYRWDFWRPGSPPYHPKDHWTGNISAFHPWKISAPEARKELVQSLSAYDGCLKKKFPDLA